MAFGNIYKNKKVFITGNTGFKGSWLNLWLNKLGAKTLGYSLKPSTNPSHFELLGDNAFETIFANIIEQERLETALRDFEPEIIFHLAAQPLVRQSYKNPKETFEVNALGTFYLLEIARKLKNLKAIVVITTDKVYENQEWIWGYRENDPLGGYDPYSASKACAEIITSSMRRSFFHPEDFGKSHQTLIATARAGNVIGGGDWSVDRLIPDIIKGAVQNTSTLIRNPYSTRPWQHVLEPLRGYLMLGEKLLEGAKEFGSSFNFGPNPEGNLTVQSILKYAQEQWDKISYQTQDNPDTPHEANLLMLDTAKSQRLLLWQPLLNPRVSISYTIQWYKDFYNLGLINTHKNIDDYLKLIENSIH